MPLSFTDEQLIELRDLAAPLYPAARAEFLRALAAEFADRSEVGDGELHRVAVALQRELLPRPARAMDGTR
jgi:hypothetical protein